MTKESPQEMLERLDLTYRAQLGDMAAREWLSLMREAGILIGWQATQLKKLREAISKRRECQGCDDEHLMDALATSDPAKPMGG